MVPPPLDLVEQAALAERHASFVGGLLVGTFWLVVVVVLGVVLLTYIKGRFDP